MAAVIELECSVVNRGRYCAVSFARSSRFSVIGFDVEPVHFFGALVGRSIREW